LPNHDPEPAARDLARVEQAQRAGREVARIGEEGLSSEGSLFVESDQVATEDDDLRAERQVILIGNRERQIPDRPNVVGDVLSDHTITARDALNEATPAIKKLNAGAVELRFDGKNRARPLWE